jgi:hypothetical protein
MKTNKTEISDLHAAIIRKEATNEKYRTFLLYTLLTCANSNINTKKNYLYYVVLGADHSGRAV